MLSLASKVPLCVDLDGTLVRTDTLHESLLHAIRREPSVLIRIPLWLLGGRAKLKREIAARGSLEPRVLPYHEGLLAYLREERAQGREIVLATAAHRSIAEAVAGHVGLFSTVLATDEAGNLKGEAKVERLKSEFGEKGFDYVGDSPADLPVWESAREAILVGAPAGTRRTLERCGVTVTREFEAPGWNWRELRRALRIHQWSKNLLLFIPVRLAHRFPDEARVMAVLAAFLSFSLVASAVYLVNDLVDLDNDRAHPTKRQRPFASGAVPIRVGMLLAPILMASGLAVATLVAGAFSALLLLYVAVTTLYSFWLKRVALADVMTLAFLYTLRVIAGAVGAEVALSPWLLGFSIFLFFSLALVKRVSEIRLTKRAPVGVRGRGYQMDEDLPLGMMGISSGYVASLVMALYMQSPEVSRLYARPEWLWPACPLVMFWISRIWLLTYRGEMPDDPILFAVRDFASYALLATVVTLITIAMWTGQ
jgi:4-hydroxybenzoate polyprenyltransferase/phosphoserine phosphatase